MCTTHKCGRALRYLLSTLLVVLQTILAGIQCVSLIEYENHGFVHQHWAMFSSQPSAWRETLFWSLFKFPFFPVVAVWMWHLFLLAEFISYLYKGNSYWNPIIQGLTWIFCLSCCRNFYRRRQQTHRRFMCNFSWMLLPEVWLAQLLGEGGKAVSKKPLDPMAKMPFRPVPALSDIPPWILKGCEVLVFPSFGILLWLLSSVIDNRVRQVCL